MEDSMKVATALRIYAVIITFLTMFSIFAATSLAQSIPFIVDIEIVDYDSYVLQPPGTTATYWVEVKNTGVLELNPIYVGVSKIPEDWLRQHESISLEFGESGKLYYDITIPETQTGYAIYSLNVYGEYGQLKASASKPVMINITSEAVTSTTTATTTSTTTIPTTTTIIPQTTTTQKETTTTMPKETTTTQIPITNVTSPGAQLSAYVNAMIEKLTRICECTPLEMIIIGLCALIAILAVVKFWLTRRH